MAIPILFAAAKGALVVFKIVKAKHAAATVARGAVYTAKAIGTANTLALGATGIVAIGTAKFLHERMEMVVQSLRLADDGDWIGAAERLTKIVSSMNLATGDQIATDAQAWVEAGSPASGAAFWRLISDLRQFVDEANITNKK